MAGGGTPHSQDAQLHMAIDFRQESNPSFQVTLREFEGPLDVLLHLIREQELDIYDIPIARITAQYLEYLRMMEAVDLGVAGEFVLMAATLKEIKSKFLLPRPPAAEPDEGPDPRDELVRRLLEYEKYREVADLLGDHEDANRLLYARTVEVDVSDLPPVPSGTVSSVDLLTALKRVLEEVGEGRAPITAIPRQKVTLRMKMSEMFRRVREFGGRMPFSAMFAQERTRTHIVMAFLALLELIRLGKLAAEQDARCGEIYLSACPEPEQEQEQAQ